MILTLWRKQNCPDFIGQNVSDVFVLRFVYLSDCFWTFHSHILGRSVPKSNASDHFLKTMKFIMRHSIKNCGCICSILVQLKLKGKTIFSSYLLEPGT